MAYTLADLNEAIAAVIPEREAIVTASRRLMWGELRDRSRRLAHVLRAAGLGCHRERDALAPWESGQDHVALYLYNGHEYLEAMIGCTKARAVACNVNYRYVEDELVSLLRDARPRAIVYHASFAPVLARVLPKLPPLALMLQVADGSDQPLLPGARDYEDALAASSDAPVGVTTSDDDLCCASTRPESSRPSKRCQTPRRCRRQPTSSTPSAFAPTMPPSATRGCWRSAPRTRPARAWAALASRPMVRVPSEG